MPGKRECQTTGGKEHPTTMAAAQGSTKAVDPEPTAKATAEGEDSSPEKRKRVASVGPKGNQTGTTEDPQGADEGQAAGEREPRHGRRARTAGATRRIR